MIRFYTCYYRKRNSKIGDLIVQKLMKMHSLGVLHNDLDTRHIFISKNGKDCKFIDFSHSKTEFTDKEANQEIQTARWLCK